jgi:hypothetical protein
MPCSYCAPRLFFVLPPQSEIFTEEKEKLAADILVLIAVSARYDEQWMRGRGLASHCF